MNAKCATVDEAAVARFLSGTRIALIGASDSPKNFSSTVFKELTSRGYDVVPVNPSYNTVEGCACYSTVGDIPVIMDGAIIMVPSQAAPEVIRQCLDARVRRLWLFKGLGGPGATSELASKICHDAGIDVVDGACPMMFLEPVGWFHRVHRTVRHLRGDVALLHGRDDEQRSDRAVAE
jgi:predicted CoA-binding protein